MGRRHSIAGKKAAGDAAKSKTYSRIGKLIEMAARKWGDDPHMNPSLDLILQKARYHSLPKEVIDKALKKGAWKIEGQELQEVTYEGYGPAGSALFIKCIASNTNRTASNVRAILGKMGGTRAEPGAVAWQFNQKGVIVINWKLKTETIKGNEVKTVVPYDKNELEEDLMNLDIEDFQEEAGQCRVITSYESFITVKKWLDEMSYSIADADIQYLPQNEITLSDEDMKAFEELYNALEEDEDVDSIYHNVA